MPVLTDALERLATRGEPAGAEIVLARARSGAAITEIVPPRRRTRRWRAVVAVAAAIVIVATGIVVVRGGTSAHDDHAATVAVHGTLPAIAPPALGEATASQLAAFHWSRLGPLPNGFAMQGPGATWDGDELLVLGIDTTADQRGLVARYRPRDGSWHLSRRAPATIGWLGGFSSVAWTGRELIALGMGFASGDRVAAVAYDPSRDRWRTLPDAPICMSNRPAAIWTGRVLVVTTGSIIHGESACPDPAGAAVAALDPRTDRWTVLPSLPRRRGEYIDTVRLGAAFDGVVALVFVRAGVASSAPDTATAATMAPGTWRITRTELVVLHAGAAQWQVLAAPATPWPGVVPRLFGDSRHAFVAPMCNGPSNCVGLQVVGADGRIETSGASVRADAAFSTGSAIVTVAPDTAGECRTSNCNRAVGTAWDLTTRRTTPLPTAPSLFDEGVWTGTELIAFGSEPAGAGSRTVLFRFGR